MEEQTVTMQDLFLFDQRGVDEEGRIVGEMKSTGLRPSFAEKIEAQGIRLPMAAELEDEWAA
jgi:pilus assembly protein CpaF